MPPMISVGRDLVSSGLHPAAHPLDAPLWVDGRNVSFSPVGVAKALGWRELVAAPTGVAAVNRVEAHRGTGERSLFLGGIDTSGAGAIWRSVDGSGTWTKVGSGLSPGRWSFCAWGDWMLATNAVGPVLVWRGSGVFESLGESWACRHLIRRGPHVLAAGCSDDFRRVRWCAQGDPETWDPLVDDSAGWLDLREMTVGVLDVVRVGDSLAVLARHELWWLDYSGYPTGFRVRFGPAVGAVGPAAAVPVGPLLYGWHGDGPWVTDGLDIRRLDDPIRSWWQGIYPSGPSSAPYARPADQSVAARHDAAGRQVLWTLPDAAGAPALTLAYAYDRGLWSVHDVAPAAWVLLRGEYGAAVGAMRDGRVIEWGAGRDAGTAPMTAWLRSKPLTGDDTTVNLHVSSALVHLASVAGGVEIRLGASRTADDEPTWGQWRPLNEAAARQPLRADGRFVTIELRSAALNGHFELGGFKLYGHTGGRR